MDELPLQRLFYEKAGGSNILRCIQCGTCSASCPLTDHMDHAPRELFALIRDGHMEAVLRSNTPWYCVSCYRCVVRCPQEIPVTDLMYSLKQMAEDQGLVPGSHKMPDLYRAFKQVVERYGRITEPIVMALYANHHPGDMLGNVPTALRLLLRGRLDFLPQRVAQQEKIRQLLAEDREEEKA